MLFNGNNSVFIICSLLLDLCRILVSSLLNYTFPFGHIFVLIHELDKVFWFLFLTRSNFLMLKPSSHGKHIDCREARKPVLSPELGFLQNTPRPTVWVRPKALPASTGVGNAGSIPLTRHLRRDGLSHHTRVFPSL